MVNEKETNSKPKVVFELSFEVCNKVGGIYTVLSSKAALMTKEIGYENYFAVGPYFQGVAKEYFEELTIPEEIQKINEKLKKQGIKLHFGKWLIKGEPKTILIEFQGSNKNVNELKNQLWNDFKIDSLNASYDFNEPVLWSYACSELIKQISKEIYQNKNIIVHTHEWLAGISLLFLNNIEKESNEYQNSNTIRTIFTTHATMLGRALAGSGFDLYNKIGTFDPKEKAYELNVQEKFLTEKACANNADIFSTVSEITAYEAENLLGKKPDVLLYNGIDMDKYPTIEETSIKHVASKKKLKEFLTYYFFPHYNFNLKKTMLFSVSGRFEFHNKGMDLLVDSLKKLNEHLEKTNSEKTVIVFFFVPYGKNPIKQSIYENKQYYQHIKNYVKYKIEIIEENMINNFITKPNMKEDSVYSKEFISEMKKDVLQFKRKGIPPICTDELKNPNQNPLIKALTNAGLNNKEKNKVKVIFYPRYVDVNDELLDISYYDALSGTHLAIYPSFYEPWGYTPQEAIAMGVPSITSNLAGFGRFMTPRTIKANPGLFVLERFKKSYEESKEQLFKIMKKFSELSHSERVENKINAKEISNLTSWNNFLQNYMKAYELALKK